MLYSVDKVENGLVDLLADDGSALQLRLEQFDFPVKEGMVLRRANGAFELDPEALAARRKQAAGKMQELLGKQKEKGKE